MTSLLHRKKLGLAYILTLIMSGVFLLNILCGFGINLTHHQEKASSHHTDDHSHGESEQSRDHDHGTSGDNCCDDVTAQFFSQLIKEKVPSFSFQSPKVVLVEHMLLFSTDYLPKRNFSQLQYYNNLPPPFQDCDKHVLFQTFLI